MSHLPPDGPAQPSDLQPPPAAPRRRTPLGWVVAVVVLVVALAAAGTVAVVQSDRLGDTRQDLADARDRVAELEADLADQDAAGADEGAGAAPDDPASALEDMLGGGGLEDLLGEDGLGGLLGEGGLGDLLEGIEDAPDVAACTTGVADLPDVEEADLETQFDQVADAVEQLRGESFPEDLDPTVRSGEEIREVLAEDLEENYAADVADQDRRILAALQAVPHDIDLAAEQLDLLSAQVAGYYDDETRELVVRADATEDPLGPIGLITLAHELEHALTDATVGLPDLSGFGDDEDAAYAALSMVEGSAVALQTQFQLAALNPLALFSDPQLGADADAGLDQVPSYIADSLTFPYIAGPSYACGLYGDGGWDAVEGAVADPPATTHEVLFPGTGVDPVDVADPTGPEGYEESVRRTFGAAQLSWLFAAPGDDPDAGLDDPTAAVEAWRGGEVSLFTSGEDSAVALVLAGEGLCGPVTEWWTAAATGEAGSPAEGEEALAASGDGDWGVVTCQGDDVRVGIGPSPEVARAAIG